MRKITHASKTPEEKEKGKEIMDIYGAGEKWLKDHPEQIGSARIGSICDHCGFELCECSEKPYSKELTPGPIEQTTTTGVKPHKCPVCEGRGYVLGNFYHAETTPQFIESCRSCKGEGVIWG